MSQQNLVCDNRTMFHSTSPVVWAPQTDRLRYQNKYIRAFQIYFLNSTSKWFLHKTFPHRIWPRGQLQNNFWGYILRHILFSNNQFQGPACVIPALCQILSTVWGILDIWNACVVRPTPCLQENDHHDFNTYRYYITFCCQTGSNGLDQTWYFFITKFRC